MASPKQLMAGQDHLHIRVQIEALPLSRPNKVVSNLQIHV